MGLSRSVWSSRELFSCMWFTAKVCQNSPPSDEPLLNFGKNIMALTVCILDFGFFSINRPITGRDDLTASGRCQ